MTDRRECPRCGWRGPLAQAKMDGRIPRCPADCGTPTNPDTAIDFKGAVPMLSFNWVNARLATGGGVETAEDVRALIASGVTHVIDCRSEEEVPEGNLFANSGVSWLFNGVADDGQPKPVEWFQRSLNFWLPGLVGRKTKLYAHCSAGINRGPSTAYAVLRSLGHSPLVARTMIVAARPVTVGGIAYAKDADAAISALGYE